MGKTSLENSGYSFPSQCWELLELQQWLPQANAATKEVHQAIHDAIAGQDQIVPVHSEGNGANILNLRLSSTSDDGYSGRISFTAAAGNDINNDGQYTISDCDSKLRIDFDTDGNDLPDALGMGADIKCGLPNTGFITIGGAPGVEVDGI